MQGLLISADNLMMHLKKYKNMIIRKQKKKLACDNESNLLIILHVTRQGLFAYNEKLIKTAMQSLEVLQNMTFS